MLKMEHRKISLFLRALNKYPKSKLMEGECFTQEPDGRLVYWFSYAIHGGMLSHGAIMEEKNGAQKTK